LMLRLEISDLGKRFGRRQVFEHLTAAVEEHSVLAVAGANGSGKSTLVRILCGLARPTAGTVAVVEDGVPISPAACRARTGLVAPDLSLYHELTALENLAFFAQVRGLRTGPSELSGLLERVGLAGRGDDLVGAYSSGMRQRLKYAQALLHAPSLLFLDEPTANLDDAGSALVGEIIAAQKERGILVLATNNAQEVLYGDQVLRLGE
jgi:heme exporter protein A